MSVEALTAEILDTSYALAVQILRNQHDAADAVQDSVHRLLRRPGGFDPERGSFRGWFLKVVRNGCIDRLRRAKSRSTVDMSGHDAPDPDATSPDTAAEARELQEQLRSELQQLSEAHREIILLRDWHELSYAEISDVLSIPSGTVMSRLSRAREELRLRMQRFR